MEIINIFLYQMSDTQFDQVENIETRLKTQNWMVLFDATGNNDVWVDNK